MDKIRTATGKTFDCDELYMIDSPARAYVRIKGMSIADIAKIFSDPAETAQLWHGSQYVANHTKLIAIVPEGDLVRVVLGKE